MRHIYQSDAWSIHSAGNGFCYLLTNVSSGADVFFQGEEATQFNADWEALSNADPTRAYDDICAELFNLYRVEA